MMIFYVDDIIVYSKIESEHLVSFEKSFQEISLYRNETETPSV